MKVTDCVGKDRMVHFVQYRLGELWYRCDNGFEFPVPIADTDSGAFLAVDRSTLFMRWIRAHIAFIEGART